MSKPTTANYRYTVVALLFFATTINYLDRQVDYYLKPVLEKSSTGARLITVIS